MSHFKIQKVNSLHEPDSRQIVLPKIPTVVFPSSVSLMNYPLDQLRETVQLFFEQPPLDKLAILRALKIIGCSLGDAKLISSIEKVLSEVMVRRSKGVYELLALWTTIRFNLNDFLLKTTPSFRKNIIFVIFEEALLCWNCRQQGIMQQLGKILPLVEWKELLDELKKRYEKNGSPLKITVKKCMLIKSQQQQLKEFILKWASSCISLKVERLMEFTLQEHREELEYLIENVPSMSATFINQIKLTITEENVGKLTSSNSKINSVLQTAIKEWLNEKNNYWLIVNRTFDSKFTPAVNDAIAYGKFLIKQHLQNECMTIKLLYCYFEAQYFNFERGDTLLSGLQKENWMEAYRCIGQTSSYRLINLAVLNKTLAPLWWNPSDPRKMNMSKSVKKMIEKHSDFLEDKQKEFMSNNKRIQLAYSVLIVIDKQTKQEFCLTFEQLARCLQGEKLSTKYRQAYPPLKTEVKQKQEVKKQHNIIIEAKVVRLLKRSKQNLTISALSEQSSYSIETVQLAIKRLVSKNLAEEDCKGMFKYAI